MIITKITNKLKTQYVSISILFSSRIYDIRICIVMFIVPARGIIIMYVIFSYVPLDRCILQIIFHKESHYIIIIYNNILRRTAFRTAHWFYFISRHTSRCLIMGLVLNIDIVRRNCIMRSIIMVLITVRLAVMQPYNMQECPYIYNNNIKMICVNNLPVIIVDSLDDFKLLQYTYIKSPSAAYYNNILYLTAN